MKPTARLRSFLLGSSLLASPSVQAAATLYWDANGAVALRTDGAGDWTATDQWWDGLANATWASGDSAVFGNGGAGGAVTLGSATTVGSLTFNAFTGTYTLGTGSSTITLNSGITMNSGAGAVSILSPITLGGAQSWLNNSSGLLTVGTGAVNLASYLLTIGGTGNTTVSGSFTGSGGLTKTGAGNLTLTGINTSFIGALTVNGGNVQASTSADALGGGAATLALNGGMLTLNHTAGLAFNRNTTVGGDFTIQTSRNAAGAGLSYTLGTLGIGANTLIVGGGVITSGTAGLTFGATTLSGNAAFDVVNPVGGGGTTLTLGAVGGGAYGITKNGSGTLALTDANGYSGATNVNGGTLALSGAATIASSSGITLNGGNITLANAGAATTVSGATTSSTTVVAASGTGITVGMTVTGTGISGTPTVTAVSGTTITLSTAQTLADSAAIRFVDSYNRVSDSAGITSNGGTFTYANTSGAGLIYGETIGSVDLVRGQTNFALTTNMAGGSGNIQTLTLATSGSGLTRSGSTSVVSFGSASGLNTTTNIITVFGASGSGSSGSTTSVPIIGPWAFYGTTPSAPTDYAVYDGSGRVLNANISGTLENSGSWISGANVTVSGTGTTTLTATRTINTLRYNATSTPVLALSNFNLETYGILNGNTAVTISGSGALTTPTGGGNLYLTPGAAAITVSAPINDNDGAVALVKSGSNTLTLSSTTSNFSGGTVINAGTIAFATDANFGATSGGITFNGNGGLSYADLTVLNANRTFTINEGASLTLGANLTVNGIFAGSGALSVTSADSFYFTNPNNTFTGTITSQTAGSATYGLEMASIGDTVGAGLINLVGGSGTFRWTNASGSTTTLANRQFAISGAGFGIIAAMGTTAASNLVINKDLAITGAAGARELRLDGGNTGVNTFAGNIADGAGSVVTLTKNGAGTWALGGTNTYSGNTNLSAVGGSRLVFQGSQSLSPNTKLLFTQSSSSVANVRFLDDGAGTINFNRPIEFGGTNSTQVLGIFVGNNNTANEGSSAGTTTGSTIQVGGITHTSTAGDTGSLSINVTGDNNYRLRTGTITLNNLTARTAAQTTTTILNPTGASMTVDAITMATGNVTANDGIPVLRLAGNTSDNIVTGAISNATDFATGHVLSLEKQSTSTWTLEGTNSYTGTTAISGGILRVDGSLNAGSVVTVSGGALGGTGTVSGAVTVSSVGGINLADGVIENLALSSTLGITGAANANYLTFDLASGGTTTDAINVTNAFSMTTIGAGVVRLNQLGGSANRLTGDDYDILTAGSGIDATKFRLDTTKAFGQTFSLSSPTDTALVLTTTQVTTNVGNKTLSNLNASWATAANFTGSVLPDYKSNVKIDSNVGTSPLNGSTNINSLTFGTSATTGVTISAGTATTGTPASMLVIEAGAVNDNTAGDGIILNNTSGSHTISANIGLAASQKWTLATGSTLTASGVISDFGGNYSLTKAGNGRLILSNGANTYTGNTVINGGFLRFGTSNSNTWGATTPSLPHASNLEINGGIAEVWYSTTRDLGAGPGQVQFTGGRSGISNFQSDHHSALTFTSASTVVTWGSDYFKPTTLVLNDVGAQANYRFVNPFDLNGAARTVEVAATGAGGGRGTHGNLAGALSGTGASLIKTGAGTLILSAANTYTGGSTINQGGLWFQQLTSMPKTGAVTVNDNGILSISVGNAGGWTTGTSGNGTIGGLLAGLGGQAGGTVSYVDDVQVGFNITSNQAYAGDIDDVGTTLGLHIGNKDGGTTNDFFPTYGFTLTLSGDNSYTGGTTLNRGTLSVGSATALGTGTGTINFNGGTIQSSDATLRTFTNVIAVNSDITVGTTGNLTFSNTGTVALGASRIFTINGGTTTFAQSFTGTGNTLTKAGAGTLVLSGNNSGVTGGTTLSGGTLILAGANALPAGTLTWGTTNTTLRFENDSNLAITNTLTTSNRDLTRTLVVDRLTPGAAINLSFSGVPNLDSGTAASNTLNFQKGADITSGTPTITFTNGVGSSDSNNHTFATVFNPTDVDVVINGISSSGRTRIYTFQGNSTGNRVTGTFANGNGTTVNKSGSGTWTFAGTSQYTGATTVNQGTLVIGVGGSLSNTAITVNNAGSTFAVTPGSGTINLGTTVAGTAGATLNLTSGTSFSMVDGATGTANLQQQVSFATSGLTLSGASLNFEVGAATADKLAVTKAASVSGSNLINVAGVTSMGGGPYDLITAPSGLSGTYNFGGSGTTSQTVAVGTNAYALTLGNSGAAVTVTVGAATSITGVTWTGQTNGTGATNSNWDNAISNNWAANTTASAVSNGTAVTFDDTNAVAVAAITNSTVTVAASGVSPTSTTFNNSSANYTVGGGTIGGAGGLTKDGTGTVTLSGANTYTGATNVNDGTLLVSGSIGVSAVTLSNADTVLATDAAASFGSTLAINSGAILAVGGAAAAGTATVAGATTFNNSSIFSWDISADGLSYDKLIAPSLAGEVSPGDAIFRIVVADDTFAADFWDSEQTWTNIFTTNGTTAITDWAALFTVSVVKSDFTPLSPTGSFSISGNTLSYSLVPEPTSALVGLLVGAGLLRRRRN